MITQSSPPTTRASKYTAGVTLTNIANKFDSKPYFLSDDHWDVLQKFKGKSTKSWEQHILPETLATLFVGSATWGITRHVTKNKSWSGGPSAALKGKSCDLVFLTISSWNWRVTNGIYFSIRSLYWQPIEGEVSSTFFLDFHFHELDDWPIHVSFSTVVYILRNSTNCADASLLCQPLCSSGSTGFPQ
jgi:hypothetical protein